MGEKYGQLLVSLASKLGTTAEFLWAVLVKQAYISAWIQIGYTIFVCILGIVLYKVHRMFCVKRFGRDKDKTYYYEYEEAVTIPMVIVTVGYSIVLIVLTACIGDIFIKFISPEYYALDKILTSIKQSLNNSGRIN